MSVFSVRIDSDLKKKMEKLNYLNWSELIRRYLETRIEMELKSRRIDAGARREAIEKSKQLKSKYDTDRYWNSTEELRKWREHHK